ncbi:MAG: DUF58 domain-containing protein [Microbacteriaceae bacterium]
MTSLLYRVKSKLYVRANRKVIHLLDGEYSSMTRGRSLDFDDLRGYVVGDEVKDIDWKATARHTTPLVKRYLASKRQRLVFIANTGKNMAALSEGGDSKRDLLILAIGVLGSLASQHGDEVSLIYGDGPRISQVPEGNGDRVLERILQSAHQASQLRMQEHDILELFEFAYRTIKMRSILVVVTDELPMSKELEMLIRRLNSKHEVLWLTLGDADPLKTKGSSFDVDEEIFFPDFLRGDSKLGASFAEAVSESRAEKAKFMQRLGISHQFLSSEDETVLALFRMLQRRMFTGV